MLKADNHIEVPLIAMKCVSVFECSVHPHPDTGALSGVSGRGDQASLGQNSRDLIECFCFP